MLSWKNFEETEHFNLQDAISNWGEVKFDPYMVWAFSTDFSYLQLERTESDVRLPVLIEFSRTLKSSVEEDVSEFESILGDTDFLKFFYKMPETRFATAEVSCKKFFQLLTTEAARLVTRFDIGLTAKVDELDQFFGEKLYSEASIQKGGETAQLESLGGRKQPPIVGIIDDGFAFLNQKFQTRSKKSRIHYLWDQNSVQGSKNGRLFTQEDLNKMIKECYGGNASYAIMEELIYRREHMVDLARSVSHGTHLLDVAAGENPYGVEDSDPKELLAVRLQKPQLRFSDTTGMWLKVRAFEALQFLMLAADHVSQQRSQVKRDLVVNLSYGNLAGPHNGSSILEEAIDFAVKTGPELRNLSNVSVHIASGNQRQARGRASFTLKGSQSQTLQWKVMPDDATPNFLELWFDREAELKDVRIKVTPPTGEAVYQSSQASQHFEVGDGGCKLLCSGSSATPVCVFVSLPADRTSSGDRAMALIAVSPTNNSVLDSAPPGIWQIEVINLNASNSCAVEAWIQRDQATLGDPIKGRQSYFEDPDYTRFDSYGFPARPDLPQAGYVQLHDTVSGIATGGMTETVGAYRYSGREVADYSGLGKNSGSGNTDVRSTNSSEDKTLLYGVSEDSIVCEGVIASGTRSGSRVALNGTSVATANATRHLFEYGEYKVAESDASKLKVTEEDSKQKLRRIQVKST